MFRRDILKDEIDRFGEFMKKLLEKIVDFSEDGPFERVYEEVDAGMTELLNRSLKEALILSDEEFLDMVLSESHKLKSVELLAEVFYNLALKGEFNDTTVLCYQKSLHLYQHVQNSSTTYSFEIHQKIEKINEVLGSH